MQSLNDPRDRERDAVWHLDLVISLSVVGQFNGLLGGVDERVTDRRIMIVS
jgi:hypothetical protein